MKYTLDDYRSGKCTLDDVNTEIPEEPEEEPLVEGNSSDLVSNYLQVFHRLGGVKELERYARENQGKFYDQLLKVLLSMRAPEETAKQEKAKGTMSDAELENMSTADLKRMLLSRVNELE